MLFSLGEVLNNCLHGSVPLYPWKAINVIMSLLKIIFMISFTFTFATGELATKQKSGKVVIDWEYCFAYESLCRAKKMAFFTYWTLLIFGISIARQCIGSLHSYPLRCAAVCFWWTISVLLECFVDMSSVVRSRLPVVMTLINSYYLSHGRWKLLLFHLREPYIAELTYRMHVK